MENKNNSNLKRVMASKRLPVLSGWLRNYFPKSSKNFLPDVCKGSGWKKKWGSGMKME